MIKGAYILFGFVIFALVLLCVVAFIAKKYLNGDCTKIKEVEEAGEPLLVVEEEENKETIVEKRAQEIREKYRRLDKRITAHQDEKITISQDENIATNLKEKTSLTLLQSAKTLSAKAQEESNSYNLDPSGSFAGNGSVDLILRYVESSSCIVGNIKSAHGLNLAVANCPKEICFHMKLLPKAKFRMRTPWRPVDANELSLTFTVGPVKTSKLLKCLFCVRLYGRLTPSRFAKQTCYGEFVVTLSHLLGQDCDHELTKRLSPKNQFQSIEDLRFSESDSDVL